MKTCKVCGSTIDDIVKAGSIGCPECYNTFKDEFKNALSQQNVDIVYKGVIPEGTDSKYSGLVDKTNMEKKLEEAIESEEYEKAALYRDYLKVLNNGNDKCEYRR